LLWPKGGDLRLFVSRAVVVNPTMKNRTDLERSWIMKRSEKNGQRLNRREFMRLLAIGSASVVGADLLAACGGGGSETPTTGVGPSPSPSQPSASMGVTPTPVVGASPTPAVGPTETVISGEATPPVSPTGTAGRGLSIDISSIPTSPKEAPDVPNAEDAKRYSGQTITYYGDSVGTGHDFDVAAANKFKEQTGINVKVIPRPKAADQQFQTYSRLFQAKSPNGDVLLLDVIWPPQFAPFLLNLSDSLGDRAQMMYPGTIQASTVNNALVAMPWFTDFGLLYYRKDLLQKYGINNPPATWDELERYAKQVMDAERQAGNRNFYGFVWQGQAYEGLTCNALEWLASTGGGTFIDQNGKVTINNPNAVEMLNRVRGWVGSIAPRGVTTYQEDDSANAFVSGSALFCRQWPYVYALASAEDSKIRGKFDVTALPARSGEPHAATIGGQSLGISRFSQHQEAAIEFVRYLTSPEVLAWRAIAGSYAPPMPGVSEIPEIVEQRPFLKVQATRVARPSAQLGTRYNQGSNAIYQGVHNIENGADAKTVLPTVAQQLQSLVGSS